MASILDAAARGDFETLRRLLASGKSPGGIPEQDRAPLHYLCKHDNGGDRAACFELLRDAGANLEASSYYAGYRPLHFAANSASVELVSLLVQARVNVDATDRGGATALHLAARKGAADCVEVLLAAGADVDARTSQTRSSPLDVALTHRSRRTWPLFLRAGAEIPTNNTDPYIVRVRNAGGFKKYAQEHLARITSILAPTPLLPPELVRHVVSFWLHAGYY